MYQLTHGRKYTVHLSARLDGRGTNPLGLRSGMMGAQDVRRDGDVLELVTLSDRGTDFTGSLLGGWNCNM